MAQYKGFIIDGENKVKLHKIPVLYCDVVGINKKKYPKSVVVDAVENYKKLCKEDPTRRYIFAKHPKDDDEEWIGLLAGIVDDIYIEGNIVYADATLFPTKWGYLIYWLIKNGYTIGVSIRGKSSFNEINQSMVNIKSVLIKESNYLVLEGFDFVVFPSYVYTQVKSENIKEKATSVYLPYSYGNDISMMSFYNNNSFSCIDNNYLEVVKEQANENNIISYDKIFENIYEKTNVSYNDENKININWRYEKMYDNKEFIQTEIERLKLEKSRNEIELERIKEKVMKDKVELNNLEEKIKEKTEELKGHEIYLEKLIEMKKEYESIKEKYENTLKEYELKSKDLEELNNKINEMNKILKENEEIVEEIKEKRGELVMRCCGGEFSKDNPPKIRVVPIEEKVSKATWGDVNHTDTKKLVYLTGDKKIAEEVFGVVEGMDHWLQLKYPVYQHEKSEKKGYDVDLVLNYYGLKSALAFMEGRPGRKLSPEQRKRMINWLLEKYNALKENKVIEEIPESLLNMKKMSEIKEKVEFKFNNKVSMEIFNLMLENGLLDIELDETNENIKEQVNSNEKISLDIDEDLLISNATLGIVMALNNENLSKIIEQVENSKFVQINSFEEGINAIWNLINDSDIAEDLGLNVKDDFINYINDLIDKFLNNEVVDGLKSINMLQNALRGTGAVHIVIPMILFGIDKKTNTEDTNTLSDNQNIEDNNKPQEDVNEGENSAKDNNDNKENLYKVKEKINKEEDEEMKKETFDALKNLLENSFDDIVITDENELIPIVEKVVDDYATLWTKNDELESNLLKKDILLIAYEKGVNVEKVKEKVNSIDDINELKKLLEDLKNDNIEDVKEKASSKESGKGYSIVDRNTKKKDEFDDILESI